MSFTLNDRYTLDDGTIYLTGIQALVRTVRDRALLDRSRGQVTGSFVSGYEGSPLAGYDIELARRSALLAGLDVVHRPAVNEELAATSVMGTQLARQVGTMRGSGVTGYWYGKSPGLDRASDAIRHANLVGTDPDGGVVAFVGDDPGGKSSSLACASEVALADLLIPTLYPADAQEVIDYGLHAPYLSRHTGTWAALKIVTAVADGACTAVVGGRERSTPGLAGLEASTYRPDAHLVGPNLLTMERSLVSQRLPRALEYARHHGLNTIVRGSDADRIGIISSGKTYLDVREALTTLGIDSSARSRHGIRLLKLGMIWPLDPQLVAEFADGLDEIIVVEEKRPFIENGVKEILYGSQGAPLIIGKSDEKGRELVSPIGELDADLVTRALARRLADVHRVESALAWKRRPLEQRTSLPLLTRTPYFCSGCPHNSSTKVPDDTLIGGGIGCHAMVMMMDDKQTGRVTGLTQMGGEGAQWLGMAPFLEESHFIQNIGDGTFTHSGSLAVRAAVAAGENITYKLLYNATVAMTGGQDPVGELSLEQAARLLLAEGVAKVVVSTEDRRRIPARKLPRGIEVRERGDIVAIQEELASVQGVTVLIHDQECAAEKRRKRKRGLAETPATRVMINERICEGCGDCGEKSNCMSVHPVETEYGRKTRIHQSSCNLDFSCLDGDCPSFVEVTPGKTKSRKGGAPDIAASALPAPGDVVGADDFGMRIMGVGGTGVVTISQIIATAAVIDGHHVRSLDQTGLAQKGGAVVSDLRITPATVGSKLTRGSADLYLVCDALVGTDPANLKVASSSTTVAVASTTEVPTGQMVVDTSVSFPSPDAVRSALESSTARTVSLDAGDLAERLFGHEQFANMILVGAAFQLGRLPMSAEAVETAIMLNGASAEKNVQAFRRGRQSIAAPEALVAVVAPREQRITAADERRTAIAERIVGSELAADTPDLRSFVIQRASDLIDYANEAYARRYVDGVARTWAAERRAASSSTALTEAVATYLHKLMAYKDEYEVARLILDPAMEASVADQFGPDATYRVKLHPPMLRSMGLGRKLGFGPRTRPVFRALRRARRVRGTRWDVFGYHPVRRIERSLINEYDAVVSGLLRDLGTDNLATAVKIASLPDQIRGYERIKLDNVAAYRRSLRELRAEFEETGRLRTASADARANA